MNVSCAQPLTNPFELTSRKLPLVELKTPGFLKLMTFASQHSAAVTPGCGGENPPGVEFFFSSRSQKSIRMSSQAPFVPLKLRWNGGFALPVPTLTYLFFVGIVTTQSVLPWTLGSVTYSFITWSCISTALTASTGRVLLDQSVI